jgi:hypothetical protein
MVMVQDEGEERSNSWVSLSRAERQDQADEMDSRDRDSEFLYLAKQS